MEIKNILNYNQNDLKNHSTLLKVVGNVEIELSEIGFMLA